LARPPEISDLRSVFGFIVQAGQIARRRNQNVAGINLLTDFFRATPNLTGKRSFIEDHAQDNKEQTEIPRAQRQPSRPSLQQIIDRRGKNAIEAAYTDYGYKMREIAEEKGISPILREIGAGHSS